MPYKNLEVKRAKACEYTKAWRRRNTERAREVGRASYAKNHNDWKPQPNFVKAARMREYRRINLQKMRAYEAVKRAVKSGKMVRPKICTSCHIACKPVAHHYAGYDLGNRLNVRWLCLRCHMSEHVTERAQAA